MSFEDAVLKYHSEPRPGKLSITPTKAMSTREDLMLAYTPGVAIPCMKIHENVDLSYQYTCRSNLVGVVTNGTAVLGLGNIGAYAAKPVMEGKAVLFKRFADIDVFDIELNAPDVNEFIRACQMLEPTLGGINLEDVKAPDCFVVEETLRKTMKIPIFHDDQHGTSIITTAALLNALDIARKDISKVRIVFSGAGAAALACAGLFVTMGAREENITICDSKGVMHTDRDGKDLNPYKMRWLRKTTLRSLKDAMKGADVFVGVSVKGVVTPDMIASMSDRPIVFAMANPDPEIDYPEAMAVRRDIIMATGRSDYPNQVNNVLCFPFMFRGALDVRATTISDDMKTSAVKALAALAREPVPESVSRAYGNASFRFGPEYFIPKPFDPRALIWVSTAVAEAAIRSGVSRIKININDYRSALEDKLGRKSTVIRHLKSQIVEAVKATQREHPKIRIVFPEGLQPKILKAAQVLRDDNLIEPIVLGDPKEVKKAIDDLGLVGLETMQVLDPEHSEHADKFAEDFFKDKARKGMTKELAHKTMRDPFYFGAMMVKRGLADGYLGGITTAYPDAIRPIMRVIGVKPGTRLSSVYAMLFKDREIFFSDPSVNTDPTAEDLAEIALNAAQFARRFEVVPEVAMLSFSNFGSNEHPEVQRIQEALKMIRERAPTLSIDGEMQADTAVCAEIMREQYPACTLKGPANVLIFPNLASGNIAYKLLQRIGGAEAIGPMLVGMQKAANVLQRSSGVDEIVHMAVVTGIEAVGR
jgi:malate dehydrogenase (oxaloacetate-decarboxylating)(NADP+)